MIKLSKHSFLTILFLGVLLLNGCRVFSSETPIATIQPATAVPQTATETAEPEPTAEAVARAELQPTASPTPKPLPTSPPTQEPKALLTDRLRAVIASKDWPVDGLNAETAARWEAFAKSEGELSSGDQKTMEQFIDRWELLHNIAEMTTLPDDAMVVYRVDARTNTGSSAGPVLYAVVSETDTDVPAQLFLIARDDQGEPVGLVAAPVIAGLAQHISANGWLVEYVDPQKERVLLRADARKMNPSRQAEQLLKRRLDEVYRKNSPFASASIYPRFYFPVEGVGAGFFLVEETLSFQQILQLNEAFALFERPGLESLKNTFFSANTSVLIVAQMDLAAGMTYSGTGVIELDRRDLFGNKYYLAEVLAHEGSHVLQGRISGAGGCEQVLQREVGDKTIPPGFLEWTGEELIAGVRAHTIGAYHVSLWVLSQVGLRGREIELLREVIQTGQMAGQSLTPFCKD